MGSLRPSAARAECGAALATALHVLLLLVVLGEIVYLASRNRVRFDLTTDQLWSSTDSTRAILDKLDKRLVIEAYFSPKEKLPVNYREMRVCADNFLDELVQAGKGKVVVQRFDPNADNAVAERCNRIGVQPINLRSTTSTSLSLDRHWQGLRLVYGGGKQKVLPQFLPQVSYLAEAILTPAIKEVFTETKPKLGYMEWQSQAPGPQQRPGGVGWDLLRTHEGISKRYEFQNLKDEDGALLPADLGVLVLYRPSDLTDRQKYVIDQFVVRGGTLVVFADAADYVLGPHRPMSLSKIQVDAAGSAKRFSDQLLSYGIDWRQKVLADMADRAHSPQNRAAPMEYLSVPQMTVLGKQYAWAPYPYFFHAVAGDWRQAADQFARGADGQLDKDLAESYRKTFVAGMPADDLLWKAFKEKVGRGPGFYWPTWVGLRERAGGVADLPEGVTGRVLLWSSPAVLAEDPPQSLDALGRDPKLVKDTHTKFMNKLGERMRAEPRQQAPLMVEVKGVFSSFFAGADRPKRPSEIKEEEARKAEDAKNAEAPKDGEKKEGEQPEAAKPELAGPEVPKAPDAQKAALPQESAMVTKGTKPGRIVVVGDSTFLRDDLVRGDYRDAGGPVSTLGPTFFAQMLDWLAEDTDLVALQARLPVDRSLKLVDDTVAGDARTTEQAVRRKTNLLLTLNVLLPGGLLGLFGLFVLLVRRAQKRSFLTSLPS